MTTQTEKRQLALTPASAIASKRQRWLWENRVPLGTATIFAGRGGEGKSTFALHLTALLNQGALPGDLHGEPAAALIVSHEDSWPTVMNPRLVGAGADLDKVFRLKVASVVDDVTLETVPSLPLDIGLIRDAINQTGARLIIVDPITATIGGDLYKVADVRRALDPLLALAEECDVAVIAIMHLSKGAGNASEKVSGSHSFRDAARSLMLFATDDETGHHVVTVDKSSYSQAQGESFAFDLRSVDVTTDDDETTSVARVVYLGDTDVTVSEIINRGAVHEDEGTDAESWLLAFLTDQGGSAPAKKIIDAAAADGFAKATIQRTGKRICDKASSGFQGSWTWTLKQGSHQGSKGSHLSKRGNYENDGENYAPRAGREGATEGVEGAALSEGDPLGTFVTPSAPREPADKEEAPVSYSDHRPQVAERANLTCPVCGQPEGQFNPGYCDRLDNAHANHRADAEAVTA